MMWGCESFIMVCVDLSSYETNYNSIKWKGKQITHGTARLKAEIRIKDERNAANVCFTIREVKNE